MSFAPETEPFAKPQDLLRVPVGMASPLWGLFAGVAMTGATWWWMTRWARPQNLEAMFAVAEAEVVVAPEMAAISAPVVEAVETVIEAVPEPVVEATPEPVMEAAVEAAPEPIAEVEAAPSMPEPIAEAIAEAAPALDAFPSQIAEPFAAVATPLEAAAEPVPSA